MNKKLRNFLLSGIIGGTFCAAIAYFGAEYTIRGAGYIVDMITHDETFTAIFMQFYDVKVIPSIFVAFAVFLFCGCSIGSIALCRKIPLKLLIAFLALILLLVGYAFCIYFASVKGIPMPLIVKIVINILNSGII